MYKTIFESAVRLFKQKQYQYKEDTRLSINQLNISGRIIYDCGKECVVNSDLRQLVSHLRRFQTQFRGHKLTTVYLRPRQENKHVIYCV